ncbi:MAG: hypothetical protein ACT4PP_08110 [Sporichthyaceae bacterium]
MTIDSAEPRGPLLGDPELRSAERQVPPWTAEVATDIGAFLTEEILDGHLDPSTGLNLIQRVLNCAAPGEPGV